MSNEKQIEEIDELTTVLYEANHKKSVLDYRWLATEAYNAGYRKQSEVIKEFVKRFEMLIGDCAFTLGQAHNIQYALKKATEEMEG